MAKKERPISVLWIDDEYLKLDDFRALLNSHRILVKGVFSNSQEGMLELSTNAHKYEAVILDAKALRKKDDEVGLESIKSLRDSINAIARISHEQKRKIPFCIYTGYYEEIGESWEDDLVIFKKGLDQEPMIDFIKQEVANLPHSQVLANYQDAFEIFDAEFFDTRYRELLLNISLTLDSKERQEIEDSLVNCRKVLEGILKRLLEIGRLHPDLFHADGRPNLGWCIRYLDGKSIEGFYEEIPPQFIPNGLGSTLKMISDNGSSKGAHDSEAPPTNYNLKSTFYGLLDALVWLHKVNIKEGI